MAKVKQISFEMTVTVPADTDPDVVKEALNAPLDNVPGGDAWTVGALLTTGVSEAFEDESR